MDEEATLSSWLEALHLQEYISVLTTQGYETPQKCSFILDKQALRDLGVSKMGHVNRLFRAIEKLRGEDNSSSTLPHGSSLTSWVADENAKARSMTLLSSTGKQPPPVPIRRSVRRVTSSPAHSRTPTPDGSQEQQETMHHPPPVLPRGKSLRRSSKTSELRRGGTGGDEVNPAVSPSKPGDQQLSPIPQSPMIGAVDQEPVFPVSIPNSSQVQSPPLQNHIQEPCIEQPTITPPLPKPRKKMSPIPPRRTSSNDKPAPLSPVRKTEDNVVANTSSANEATKSTPVSPTRPVSITSPAEIPPLPPKKSDTVKPIVIPPEDVVFELENIPMPSPTTTGVPVVEGNSNMPPPPALPPKDSGPPSFAPPPLPPERKYFKTESTEPKVVTPPLPRFDPPPPPIEDMQAPSPDNLDRNVSPVTSVQVHPSQSDKDDDETPSLVVNGFGDPLPPLPPKETITPPPPPPITAEDYPQDSPNDESYSGSESEDEGQFMSIQSSKLTGKDVLSMTVSQTSASRYDDDQYSSSSLDTPSNEGTPVHRPTVIRQQLNGLKSGANAIENDTLMMVTSPTYNNEDDNGDEYMNQEVIDQVLENDEEFDEVRVGQPLTVKGSGNLSDDLELNVSNYPLLSQKPAKAESGHDYMNQEAIEQAFDDEDEDEKYTSGEPIKIRTKAPIKSRTIERQQEMDKDYENQEMLDEDILPFVTLPADQLKTTPVNWQTANVSEQYSASSPVNPLRVGLVASPDYDMLPPAKETQNHVPVMTVTTDDSVSRESSVGIEDSLDRKQSMQQLPVKECLGKKDSLSGTFPRTKSDVGFSGEYTSDSSSSIATTPGSMDFDSSYSLSVDAGSYLGGSAPKSSGDFFDGGHLIRTAGTFACGDTNYKRPDFRRIKSEGLGDGQGAFTESIYAKSTRHGSETFHDVPKTKEGYLYKKGGRRSERPWQKRWMTFNGSELKYFKNQSDKDKSFRNIVPLHEMIDIKKVPDDEKQHRFDLVVINRVFQFYSASADESQAWVDVLHAAISKFRPQEHEFKEGGNMHDPNKQGVLMKQGHGALNKGFKERYVALKGSKFAYYEAREDFVQGRPIHVLEMSLSSVRPDTTSKLPRFIITMNNMKQYVFQASNELVRKEWLDTMTTAILTGLDTRPQTIARGGQRTTSQDILAQVQEDPSNKTCADCSSTDACWGVINKGIMVCINCSGVHRSLGTHVSKVRSIELDRQIWKTNLIKLMVDIGNENSNRFWERHFTGERLPHDVERDIRENFIRAKYETKSWIPRPTGENQETLNKLLCVCVQTDNLMRTIELLAHGAQACGNSPPSDPSDPEASFPLAVARKHNQDTQVELLEQNGGLICKTESSPQLAPVNKKGHLYKTGSDRSGWKRRFCSLDKFRGFEYFKSESDTEVLGYIHMEEMLSVSRCDDESSRDPRYKYCFEVNTQSRGYLFCADTEEDMTDWVRVFEQIIKQDAAENLGYDKVGYMKKKDHMGGYKRRWFTLKGKSLACYRREREEIDEIDLRKVTELKAPDPAGTYEQQCTFSIFLGEKTYQLRADNPVDADSWIAAIKHTQVSGIPLAEQQLTSTGIPILVHKCLQFVESHGMETEGLYRLSGGKANSRKLVLAFNQDARGVVIDQDVYTVHDVTGTLKQFFRNLPDPLLTHRLYQSFINTIQSDHESQMYQLQSLIEQLPPVNRETLRRVAGHLKKVAECESKNKMSLSNLVRLFAPTLMTVDGDPVTFENTQHEYTCVHTMIKHYKWLFQVDEQEEKQEEAIEAALRKIKEADMMQTKMSTISSSMDFLTRVYIGSKDGDSYGIHITGTSLVSDVVEKVTTDKALPPNHYALYLVLGDSESHRVLSFTERLLAVLCSTGSDCFLCLKPNTFGETLKQYIDYVKDPEPVTLQVREKKKWKKYPCTVRNDQFIQYKDSKCHHEHFKLGVLDFDVFAGIEGSKLDVKNPLPTRYCFWLKAMRGEDKCKYLCAETEDDMLRIFAWIVKAKYPDRLQTPLLPTTPPPASQPPVLDISPKGSPIIQKNEELRDYANLKVSGEKRV